jgi:hypothetical protein
MQTNDQDPPSTAPEKPSGAAGGSLRDQLRDFVDRTMSVPNYEATLDMSKLYGLTPVTAKLLLDELDRQWTEILVLRGSLPKISHDDAERSVARIENLVHRWGGPPEEIERLRSYIRQQRVRDRERNG